MLTGEKITLRPPGRDDLGALYEIESELATWEQRSPRPPRAMTREWFEDRFTTALTEDTDSVAFVVEVDGAVVGHCDLFRVDNLARSAEVGIALRGTARGQGLGTDALRVLVAFGFVRRNLHRQHLTVLSSNAGGLACYRKVGFVEEGRRRESAWVRGAYEDEVEMGLLRSEWVS